MGLLRLQDFPRGLGKGSDAAVVGAWLGEVLANVNPEDYPVSWYPTVRVEQKTL